MVDNDEFDLFSLESKENKFTNVQRSATEAFANHVLKFNNTYWVCHDPNTEFYSFNIIFLPKTILLWGDVGTLVIDDYINCNLDWMIRSIDNPEYILSQCSLTNRDYFYSGDFKNYIISLNRPDIVLYVDNDWSRSAYIKYQVEFLDTQIQDEVCGFRPGAIWCYQALKKFVDLYKIGDK